MRDIKIFSQLSIIRPTDYVKKKVPYYWKAYLPSNWSRFSYSLNKLSLMNTALMQYPLSPGMVDFNLFFFPVPYSSLDK